MLVQAVKAPTGSSVFVVGAGREWASKSLLMLPCRRGCRGGLVQAVLDFPLQFHRDVSFFGLERGREDALAVLVLGVETVLAQEALSGAMAKL